MSSKEKNSPYTQILVAVAIAILVGSTTPWWWAEVRGFFIDPPTEETRCDAPWEWDPVSESCIMNVTISPKTFSIPLETPVRGVNGRIDFYANVERLPGTDREGNAKYKNNKGALQVVIPIMLGDRMVGDMREVIFSTDKGAICKVAALPETTGWLKKMRVAYSLRLDTDCGVNGSYCQANVVESGDRVQVKTSEFRVKIGKNCAI